MKHKVTIGICVRNCEDFIEETIESIANQDFPHELMELIFVDESEDNTLAIIKECVSRTDIPAKIFHVSGKGLGYARNVVVTNAEGDFVLWVDGDMTLSKDFVTKQVLFMERHPKVGIARGKQILEPATGLLATLEAYSRAAGRMVDYQSEKARSKALGTGGAICRVGTLSDVGGFDENLRGYCEDWDIEIRVKAAGWSLCMTDAEYLDYERHGLAWKTLWNRYWSRGYHTHYFLHKNRGMIKHYRMFPPAALIAGLMHSHKLFKLTHQKSVFLLPLQYLFKMTAWYTGFMRSHWDSYEPKYKVSPVRLTQHDVRLIGTGTR
jgi:glycosyltransferase involved in cell wall biosynthesis